MQVLVSPDELVEEGLLWVSVEFLHWQELLEYPFSSGEVLIVAEKEVLHEVLDLEAAYFVSDFVSEPGLEVGLLSTDDLIDDHSDFLDEEVLVGDLVDEYVGELDDCFDVGEDVLDLVVEGEDFGEYSVLILIDLQGEALLVFF